MLYIMDAELIEGNYVLYQGDLSTNCVCCWEKLIHPGHLFSDLRRVWPGLQTGPSKKMHLQALRTGRHAYDSQNSSTA
ncbi:MULTISPECIES: hypothetical protein [Pseudomonas syringae group]|uniref:hypothetical protein n=1 Tax=Pseudomonas syringae group TaxID=136849 RepID=UPI0011EA7142|nr:hypothetical protein [Pseudomonas syringae group genomosp. 7]